MASCRYTPDLDLPSSLALLHSEPCSLCLAHCALPWLLTLDSSACHPFVHISRTHSPASCVPLVYLSYLPFLFLSQGMSSEGKLDDGVESYIKDLVTSEASKCGVPAPPIPGQESPGAKGRKGDQGTAGAQTAQGGAGGQGGQLIAASPAIDPLLPPPSMTAGMATYGSRPDAAAVGAESQLLKVSESERDSKSEIKRHRPLPFSSHGLHTRLRASSHPCTHPPSVNIRRY